ncbi:MAG: AAA family ATPase [Lachnospiraceae bacterium]|nr:AAA family ATPase [Lachnospiraceae bacterium]
MDVTIRVEFQQSWLYGGGGANSFAVSRFLKQCERLYAETDIEVHRRGLDRCEFSLPAQNQDSVLKELASILEKDYQAQAGEAYRLFVDGAEVTPDAPSSDAEDVSAQDGSADDSKDAREPADRKEDPAPASGPSEEAQPSEPGPQTFRAGVNSGAETAKAAASVMDRVENLIGADDFKSLCREIRDRAPLVKKNHTEKVFFSQTYLFTIGQGEGLTNSLELMRDLLSETGLFQDNKRHAVRELSLPSPADQQVEEKMQHLIGSVAERFSTESIISYDISRWVGHTSKELFKELILSVLRGNENCVHVFRAPVVSERLHHQTEKDLRDVLSVRSVRFPNLTADQQHELVTRHLNTYDITVDGSCWEIFDRRVAEEKSDGYFYGIRTLQKIGNEMISLLEQHNVKNETESRVITADKIVSIASVPEEKTGDGMAQLERLVGMASIKEQIRSIVRQIELSRTDDAFKKPTMHMCFVGKPGTGKTTVARLLGEILNERGLLRIGKFFEYRGRDLCGRYVGETAIKTTEICREAYGSILFIDEAYSLFRGDSRSNDFGREAIDTLIAEMENHADDLIVIFAGYPEDMELMLSGNDGMRSRIPYRLDFPDYTREELADIFFLGIPASFGMEEGVRDHIRAYFADIPDSVFEARDFGNARFCRNLCERTWGKALARLAGEGEENRTISEEDFDAAVREISGAAPEKKRSIGFI